MEKVKIHTEYIELQNLLKLKSIIHTGGEAKFFLQEELVLVNGEEERRRGKKLYPGDQVKVLNKEYLICKNVD